MVFEKPPGVTPLAVFHPHVYPCRLYRQGFCFFAPLRHWALPSGKIILRPGTIDLPSNRSGYSALVTVSTCALVLAFGVARSGLSSFAMWYTAKVADVLALPFLGDRNNCR
jgi:hypothetical protein